MIICHSLQEGDDFPISVDSNTRIREVDVSIWCLSCAIPTTLHQVKGSFVCSNFFWYISSSVNKQSAKTESKPKSEFTQSVLNFPAIKIDRKHSAAQGKVNNQQFIDLTCSNHDGLLHNATTIKESSNGKDFPTSQFFTKPLFPAGGKRGS